MGRSVPPPCPSAETARSTARRQWSAAAPPPPIHMRSPSMHLHPLTRHTVCHYTDNPAHILTKSCSATFAPAATKAATTGLWPHRHARINGVSPPLFRPSTVAPAPTKYCTVSTWPYTAARPSGVLPDCTAPTTRSQLARVTHGLCPTYPREVLLLALSPRTTVRASTADPASSNRLTTLVFPSAAAQCSAVRPPCVAYKATTAARQRVHRNPKEIRVPRCGGTAANRRVRQAATRSPALHTHTTSVTSTEAPARNRPSAMPSWPRIAAHDSAVSPVCNTSVPSHDSPKHRRQTLPPAGISVSTTHPQHKRYYLVNCIDGSAGSRVLEQQLHRCEVALLGRRNHARANQL